MPDEFPVGEGREGLRPFRLNDVEIEALLRQPRADRVVERDPGKSRLDGIDAIRCEAFSFRKLPEMGLAPHAA